MFNRLGDNINCDNGENFKCWLIQGQIANKTSILKSNASNVLTTCKILVQAYNIFA